MGSLENDGYSSRTPKGSSASGMLSPDERASIRILIIDGGPSFPKDCESMLRAEGHRFRVERDAEQALRLLSAEPFDIVLIDEDMLDLEDLQVLSAAQGGQPESIIVVTSANATPEAGVRALQAGAWDYLPKPFSPAQLSVLVARAAYSRLSAREVSETPPGDAAGTSHDITVLGVSASIQEALRRARRVARTDASVFITGESGTGKELIAQLIHRESRRSQKPFVAVNCSALPELLLESEMFGHRRGAFTGAVRDKVGLLEVANDGTFFLDEVGEMPIPLQAKLLRVLQDGVIRRVGSENDDTVVNVRWISATNRNPSEALKHGVLRKDLYFRLRVVPIHLSALRERREDIPVLVEHFVEQFWRRHRGPRRPVPQLSPATAEALVWYSWPGNVRELQNVIEHLVALSDPGEVIHPDRLPFLSKTAEANESTGPVNYVAPAVDFRQPFRQAKADLVDRFEREYLSQAVARAGGNLSQAARSAGIDRTTLYRLMEKHGLSKASLEA